MSKITFFFSLSHCLVIWLGTRRMTHSLLYVLLHHFVNSLCRITSTLKYIGLTLPGVTQEGLRALTGCRSDLVMIRVTSGHIRRELKR